MITESEKKALQLAKRVFEHFTHDALPIAKEIVALEREMAEDQDNGVTIPVILQTAPVAKSNDSLGAPESTDLQTKPGAEVNSIRIAGPLNYPRMQAEEQPAIREYVEVPY